VLTKFLGMTLNQFSSSNRNQDRLFDDPYEALQYADVCWTKENHDSKIPRLLVVFKKDENSSEPEYAFLNFPTVKNVGYLFLKKEAFLIHRKRIKPGMVIRSLWHNGISTVVISRVQIK